MKKIRLLFLVILFSFCIVSFYSCSSGKENTNVIGNTTFEYVYRGFTPIPDDSAAFFAIQKELPVILTEEDFRDFLGKYCPVSSRVIEPGEIDFVKDFLIVESHIYSGAIPYIYVSSEISGIILTEQGIEITYNGNNPSTAVYVLGSTDYLFINIVKVNKNSLPTNMENICVYKSIAE